jgi:diguanylate cyclase (GGDEF)-like protein
MFANALSNLWQKAWSLILFELNSQEISWLLRPRTHVSLLSARRATIIVSRVRLIAGLFAILTPLWILIDIAVFPQEIWVTLAVARAFATLGFIGVLRSLRNGDLRQQAYRAVAMMLTIPTLFFLVTHYHLSGFQLSGLQQAIGIGYTYLPFVMLAGLSVFPLTLFENIAFATPMLAAQVFAALLRIDSISWPAFAGSMWLLLLIAGVSLLAGISQLAFMIVLVREAVRDKMTGCFTRHSGEELLELQFTLALRSGSPLTLAFIDLDRFKSVNDNFGHDAGDGVLIRAADAIRSKLRTGDMLTRWGGEEFVLIMPNAPLDKACMVIDRLRAAGFGRRPDGGPVTASIGIAERLLDAATSWRALVEIADHRMYAAKQGGRDRIVAHDNT